MSEYIRRVWSTCQLCRFVIARCNERHMYRRVWYKQSCIYRTPLSVTEIPLKLHAADVDSFDSTSTDSVSLDKAQLTNYRASVTTLSCSAVLDCSRVACLLRNNASQLGDDDIPWGPSSQTPSRSAWIGGSAVLVTDRSRSINEVCLSHHGCVVESLPAVSGQPLPSVITSPETLSCVAELKTRSTSAQQVSTVK